MAGNDLRDKEYSGKYKELFHAGEEKYQKREDYPCKATYGYGLELYYHTCYGGGYAHHERYRREYIEISVPSENRHPECEQDTCHAGYGRN